MDDVLTETTFTPHVGQDIRLAGGGTLRLVSVQPGRTPQMVPAGQGPGGRAPFTLLLRGTAQPVVPEGLHRLMLPDGAGFDLYMIPIHTPARDHQDYQIVFS